MFSTKPWMENMKFNLRDFQKPKKMKQVLFSSHSVKLRHFPAVSFCAHIPYKKGKLLSRVFFFSCHFWPYWGKLFLADFDCLQKLEHSESSLTSQLAISYAVTKTNLLFSRKASKLSQKAQKSILD